MASTWIARRVRIIQFCAVESVTFLLRCDCDSREKEKERDDERVREHCNERQ
jgi:hypothetical protein